VKYPGKLITTSPQPLKITILVMCLSSFFVNKSRHYSDIVIIVYLHNSIAIMAVIKSYYCNVSDIILFVRPKSSCFDNEPCILSSTAFENGIWLHRNHKRNRNKI